MVILCKNKADLYYLKINDFHCASDLLGKTHKTKIAFSPESDYCFQLCTTYFNVQVCFAVACTHTEEKMWYTVRDKGAYSSTVQCMHSHGMHHLILFQNAVSHVV